MKKKSFKKETSLVLKKNEKEIIDMSHIVNMDAILDDNERPSWVVDYGSSNQICCLREGFKETRWFFGKEMTIVLGDHSRLYTKMRVMLL